MIYIGMIGDVEFGDWCHGSGFITRHVFNISGREVSNFISK
jgi:hypothetical protein